MLGLPRSNKSLPGTGAQPFEHLTPKAEPPAHEIYRSPWSDVPLFGTHPGKIRLRIGLRPLRSNQGLGLEVLDWGGSGDVVALLAGLHGPAHAFEQFTPVLADDYRVFGITRPGFGASNRPPDGDESTGCGSSPLISCNPWSSVRPLHL